MSFEVPTYIYDMNYIPDPDIVNNIVATNRFQIPIVDLTSAEEISELLRLIDNADEVVTVNSSEINGEKNELKDEEGKLEDVKGKLDGVKNELDFEKRKLDVEKSQLQDENKILQTANEKLEAEKNELQDLKIKLKAENTKLEADKNTLQTEKNRLEDVKNTLDAEKNRLDDVKNTLEAENTTFIDAKNTLEAENTTLIDAKNTLQTEKNRLEDVKNTLQTEKNRLEDVKNKLDAEKNECNDAKDGLVFSYNDEEEQILLNYEKFIAFLGLSYPERDPAYTIAEYLEIFRDFFSNIHDYDLDDFKYTPILKRFAQDIDTILDDDRDMTDSIIEQKQTEPILNDTVCQQLKLDLTKPYIFIQGENIHTSLTDAYSDDCSGEFVNKWLQNRISPETNGFFEYVNNKLFFLDPSKFEFTESRNVLGDSS